MNRQIRGIGRSYSAADVDRAPQPTGERIARRGRHANGNIDVVHTSLPEPGELSAYDLQFGKVRRTAVNRNVDILESQYAAGRISEAAYSAGREIDAAMDRARDRTGRGTPTGAGGGMRSHTANAAALARKIDSASDLTAIKRALALAAGADSARRIILACEGMHFSAQARAELCWETGVGPSAHQIKRRALQIGASYRLGLDNYGAGRS